jgi:phosphoribosylglycinamide formyltransferase
MAEACRILVMASGNGSNFQALCDAVASGQIPNSSIIRLIVNRGRRMPSNEQSRMAYRGTTLT